MTDQPRQRITIDAPDGPTILAARHLDATEGRIQVGTTVDTATRTAITRVLAYVAKAHNSPASTAEQERDGAYRERAHLVAFVAGVAEQAVIAPAPDVDEPDWQILYVTLHGRQCSWHIAPRDSDLFEHLEHVPADDPRAQWDGHTTDEKYRHIDWLARIFGTPGPFKADTYLPIGRLMPEQDDPPVQCWHYEPGSPCDWNTCRQPERLAAGDRGIDPAHPTSRREQS